MPGAFTARHAVPFRSVKSMSQVNGAVQPHCGNSEHGCVEQVLASIAASIAVGLASGPAASVVVGVPSGLAPSVPVEPSSPVEPSPPVAPSPVESASTSLPAGRDDAQPSHTTANSASHMRDIAPIVGARCRDRKQFRPQLMLRSSTR